MNGTTELYLCESLVNQWTCSCHAHATVPRQGKEAQGSAWKVLGWRDGGLSTSFPRTLVGRVRVHALLVWHLSSVRAGDVHTSESGGSICHTCVRARSTAGITPLILLESG